MLDLDPKYRWYRVRLKDENLQPCDYYFRGLTKRELRTSGMKETTWDAEQYILRSVVANSKDWDNMFAGVVSVLLKLILKYSGVDEEGLCVKEAITWLEDEDGQLEALAIAMIPSCTPDVLDNCDPFVYAKYLILGKRQWENLYGIPAEQSMSKESGPQPLIIPDRGEIGKHVESSFEYRRN